MQCDSTEQIREIWQRVAGPVAPVCLDHDPILFDRLLAEVRTAFGVLSEGLPIHEIRGKATIEGLAKLIDANLDLPSQLLVCLQPHGSLPPLFLIHAGGGYVFFYRALASRLGPDQPVYAVRAETSADALGRPFHESKSIEEVAARYLIEIRRVQPHGPYTLGGASFGGAVAFEMARLLRSKGEEVTQVLLISALMPASTARGPADEGRPTSPGGPLQRRIAHHLDAASHLRSGDAVRYVSEKILTNLASEAAIAARALQQNVRARSSDLAGQIEARRCRARGMRVPPHLLYRCSLNLRIGNRLLATYAPPACDVSATLFRAAEDDDPEPFWRGLAERGLAVHDVPGAHLSLLEEPLVATTASILRTSRLAARR